MILTFDHYDLTDDGVALTFSVKDPQPDAPAEYTVRLTEGEINAASTDDQLRSLVTERLAKQNQSLALTRRLDALLGAVLKV